MRVGIDVRYLSHGIVGGINTYLHGLLPALQGLTDAPELVLYADTKRPFELPALATSTSVRYMPWRGPYSSVLNDLLLKRLMAGDKVDVAHFPANYGFGPRQIPTVLTVHDELNLLPFRATLRGEAQAHRPAAIALVAYLHCLTRAAVRRADLIVAPSESARRAIAERASLRLDRIVAVHHGCPEDARNGWGPDEIAAVRQRHGLTCRYVLADALKNPGTLLAAWERLPADLRASHRLAFFARRSALLPALAEAREAGRVTVVDRPSRADLLRLLAGASAFAFPSWVEGFGLPILEAMALGAPVVASTRGAIPEVAAGAALLCEAEDPAALASQLTAVLGSPDLATDLRARGRQRASELTWARAARQMLDCYERARFARS
jgi:glycosyltransferase involved in cell wall biosynthesis